MQTKVALPSYEHIARVAYRVYLERGTSSGPEREDWLQAEQLLMEHLNKDSISMDYRLSARGQSQ